MILDHAATVIAEEGVSAINMERLGREVGVSKSLIYAYYPSQQALLKALLMREYKHLRGLQSEAAASAETLEQLVRRVTNAYLSYIEKRGLILDRLAAEPQLADAGDPTEYSRASAVNYLAEMIADALEIERELAVPVIDISFGLPAAAGHYLTRHDISRQTIEDITVTMILGSIAAIKDRYATSLKRIKHPVN